jgi:hypothetical protein
MPYPPIAKSASQSQTTERLRTREWLSNVPGMRTGWWHCERSMAQQLPLSLEVLGMRKMGQGCSHGWGNDIRHRGWRPE